MAGGGGGGGGDGARRDIFLCRMIYRGKVGIARIVKLKIEKRTKFHLLKKGNKILKIYREQF